jgi:hypothetical protein
MEGGREKKERRKKGRKEGRKRDRKEGRKEGRKKKRKKEKRKERERKERKQDATRIQEPRSTAASRYWKRRGKDSPIASRRNQPYWALDFSPL